MNVSRTIDASSETVWRILIDTDLWSLWGPSVAQVNYCQRWLERGAKGHIKTAFGLWLPFEVTVFDPPNYWHWKVAGLPATGHRLTPRSAMSCQLSFEFPLIAFPYGLVCKKALTNIDRLARKTLNP